ncbi:MAG: glycosyltransferase family 4 protein [Anaerolineae bacterium]
MKNRSLCILMDNLTYLKGGAEVMVLNLCQQAVKGGWNVTLAGPKSPDAVELTSFADENHFSLHLLPSVPSLLLAQPDLHWAIPFGLCKHLPKVPSVYLLNDLGPLAFACLLARPRNAVQLVYFMHTSLVATVRSMHRIGTWQLLRKIMSSLNKWVTSKSDIVVVPSQSFANELIAEGIAGTKLRIIPTGVDPFFCQAPDQTDVAARRSQYHGPVILYVGRLSHEKNLPLMLKAFALVLQDYPDTQLLLVGDGPARQQVTALCQQLRITGHTQCIGRQSWPELRAIYWAADIFCMPSEVESQGLSLLEAQACARPCVAMNKMGSADAIEHNVDGLLVDVQPEVESTISHLAAALCTLIENPDLAYRLGNAARVKATRRTNKSSAAELLALLEC